MPPNRHYCSWFFSPPFRGRIAGAGSCVGNDSSRWPGTAVSWAWVGGKLPSYLDFIGAECMCRYGWIIFAVCLVSLHGCASSQTAETAKVKPAAKSKADIRAVMSEDGSVKGAIVGTPLRGSKFAQLKIGMKLEQVENLIGLPNRTDSRITGKQYQPFYFGGDTLRTEAYYKNEGRLTFSNIQQDSAADTLIRIVVNPEAGGNR